MARTLRVTLNLAAAGSLSCGYREYELIEDEDEDEEVKEVEAVVQVEGEGDGDKDGVCEGERLASSIKGELKREEEEGVSCAIVAGDFEWH